MPVLSLTVISLNRKHIMFFPLQEVSHLILALLLVDLLGQFPRAQDSS